MTRAERRAHDERRKAKTRRVLKLWSKGEEPDPKEVARRASHHMATGRHRWCGCAPRYWKGDLKIRDRRALAEAVETLIVR